MHRQFRPKIAYDLLRFKTKGVNWVRELPLYEAILNEDPKEELGWKSPFEIYYVRKSNRVVCPLLDNSLPVPTETITAADDVNDSPQPDDLNQLKKRREQFRDAARKANERCMNRMINRDLSRNPPSIYNIHDRVLLKYKDSHHKVPKKIMS